VGGSRKSTSGSSSSRGINSSPFSESNQKRVLGTFSRSSSATSIDYAAHQNNVVTSEDSDSPKGSSAGGVNIPQSPSSGWSQSNQEGNFLPSGAPLSFPYAAPVSGSFGAQNQDVGGDLPNGGLEGGVTYAGVLGTSPTAERNAVEDVGNQLQDGMRFDDDSEFPPVTMHTDD